MAEPFSAIASAASIAGLAEVSYRLAGSLSTSFQAVAEAPQNIRRLSKELEQLHCLLQAADNLVKRHNTSLSGVGDGFSIAPVQSLLLDCKTELDKVEKLTAPFWKDARFLKDAAKRIKWAMKMREIDRHCEAVDALGRRIGIALSVLGRQHDITVNEGQKALQSQVTDVRDIIQASLAENRNQVSTELSTVRTGIEQVASKMISSQDETKQSLWVRHDRLRSEFLQTERRGFRGLETIRIGIRDVGVIRRAQRQSSQHLRRLYRSINHIESKLSELSSVQREPQSTRPTSALVQHPRLDSIMLSLMLMRSSLYTAVSQIRTAVSAKVSEEAGKFMLDEFEKLVAFSHEASALRTCQSYSGADGDDGRLPEVATYTAMLRHYSLDVDHFPITSVTTKKQSRALSHFSTLGRLEIRFKRKTGHRNGSPTSMAVGSFQFIPNPNAHSTGVFALFRKEMQLASKPFISRTLREIRQIVRDDDQVGRPLVTALINDDLSSVQRMLSSGQIRPWDQDWGGRDLLKMAAWIGGTGNILRYLVKLVGRSVDNSMLRWWIMANFAFRQVNAPCKVSTPLPMRHDLQPYIEIFRRAVDLEQTLDYGLILKVLPIDHGFVQLLQCDRREIFESPEFLTGTGADIDFMDRWGDTPLLGSARSNFEDSPSWTLALLQCCADISAVDFKERGPLHLSLRYSRASYYRQHSISWTGLQAKLVHLLRAGSQIHAVDNRGRSPTDYARDLKLKNVWVSALREADKLEDEILESLYNETECSIIDSDSDSCCSWNYEEEDVNYGEEQHTDDDNNKQNKAPIDQDTPRNVTFFKKENHHMRNSACHVQTSIPELRSLDESNVSSACPQTGHDSIIALGQHHVWI